MRPSSRARQRNRGREENVKGRRIEREEAKPKNWRRKTATRSGRLKKSAPRPSSGERRVKGQGRDRHSRVRYNNHVRSTARMGSSRFAVTSAAAHDRAACPRFSTRGNTRVRLGRQHSISGGALEM